MKNSELLLSNQLCFLIYRLDRAVMARYRPLLDELGLTYPQYLLMLSLWEKREARVGELCAALSLDTGTISPLIQRLRREGLIEKKRSEVDERSVIISLSPAGAALEKKAAPIPRALASCIGLEPDEYLRVKAELTSLLEKTEVGSCS